MVDRMYQETMKALQMPDVHKRIADLAGEPGNITEAEFAELNKAEFDRYGKLIREAKIQLQQ